MDLDQETNKILSSLIFSLAQIDSFRKYIYEKNFSGEICKIFSEIVHKNCFNKIDEYVKNIIHKFKVNNLDKNNIAKIIINYFLKELSKEIKDEEKTDIIIQTLFNGIFEFNYGYQKDNKRLSLILSFDLDDFKTQDYKIDVNNVQYISLENILSKHFKSKLLNDFPAYNNFQVIQMPEIIFIYNINIKKNLLLYYLKMDINNYPYEMVYFVLEKDDDNGEQNFFKVNNVWYKYSTKYNTIDIIQDIKENLGTPRMICYQKNKNLIQSFLNSKDIFIMEQRRILEIMKQHIIPEHEYENYYLLKKNLLNDFISVLNKNNPDDIKYNEGQITLNNMNLLEHGTKNNKNVNINFPINFWIMKDDLFKSFLDISTRNKSDEYKKVNNNDNDEKKPYLIKFGENHAFIKTKKSNKETIYVVGYDENEEKFEVIIIMQYDETGLFDDDLKKYISNRGGLEYFYIKKNLNFDTEQIQNINNEKGEKIGIFINILDMRKYINNFKYQMIQPKKENKNKSIKKDEVIKNKEVNNDQEQFDQIANSTGFQNPICLAYKKDFGNQNN